MGVKTAVGGTTCVRRFDNYVSVAYCVWAV